MKRFKILRNILLATIASSSLLNVAHADDALKMELTANQVIKNAEGKTVYKPVRTAPAGTVIQYKANYTNTINKDINDLMVTLPIPANMTFTGDAMPASAQASIDGENYADIPLMRKVDGKMVKIPYSEYRTLRWNIKLLPAKKSAAVALNTTVN
ncbi:MULTISPECIES: hypothetical protein [Psychrobacter]|jgi:uncharacterized repeat protein (TIGR01451 family)|uniref:Conserved repeat domain-containing protein n=1 Tax=Psychrobacter pacificensis TaxID=112002 RepID=A0A1G6ZC42_9GAMM|nr:MULTISPECIES: hypothetical protein [Psychrobacter]MED6317345.1 hypothetical protein [Pseudomonadota bacterium]BBI68332.1 hypothetical protein PKHYL_25230 [Psychrobacter sp. KH172YL61]GLR27920.1 hypothetical protein GCM10007915_01580 [Psychrobacter pacificensis]SDD99657.1 conserved repeat domain-containing protein [Psychrobacter pacificensis]